MKGGRGHTAQQPSRLGFVQIPFLRDVHEDLDGVLAQFPPLLGIREVRSLVEGVSGYIGSSQCRCHMQSRLREILFSISRTLANECWVGRASKGHASYQPANSSGGRR